MRGMPPYARFGNWLIISLSATTLALILAWGSSGADGNLAAEPMSTVSLSVQLLLWVGVVHDLFTVGPRGSFHSYRIGGLGLLSGVSLAQGAPPARAAEPLPAVTMPDFSALVERYGPAVVNVEVVERPQTTGRGGPDADDPLNDFFRRFGIPNPGQGQGGASRAMRRRRTAPAPDSSSAPTAIS